MQIDQVRETERTEFLSLVNAEIRPDRAKTNAEDDFPLILGPGNRENQLVCRDGEGRLAGCIACLIRDSFTSCGPIAIAGIGSVVTHPDFRGKKLSSTLQNAMLDHLRRKNVPLAVLWSDRPEIYSGRGFAAAGWEIHAGLADLQPPEGPGAVLREFGPQDASAIQALYDRHPLRTVRLPGDAEALYTMPGTRGLVAVDGSGRVQAAVFCGKGGDFPGYVAEWSGPHALVTQLLARARDLGLAANVLIPPGQEGLVNHLVDHGAGWTCLPSGLWCVLDPEALGRAVAAAGGEPPPGTAEPRLWLGDVDGDGQPLVGPLTVAVWGFDSV